MADWESIRQRVWLAFGLAWFIHHDKELALRITKEALAKLDAAAAAQDKRRYYAPGRRLFSRGRRTKVSLNESHLLQRLVYIESESYEKEREASDGGVSEDDMLVHFVKHLVRITVKRSSFYVTLGVSRLLHNFTTAQTMEIYNLVVQDPERVRDDHYYRSRKARLLRELTDRFSDFLRTERGPHGEERFETTPRTTRLIRLVQKSLNVFTPWNTTCPVPAAINPVADAIPRLCFQGGHADDEHVVEVNRFHAVLHPDCYGRIVGALKLDSPLGRVEIPRFFFSKSDDGAGGSPGDRGCPPELTKEDIAAVRNTLAEEAARRKGASAGLLRILVDGVERARLDPRLSRHARLEIDDSAELVEIRAVNNNVLLTCHLLTTDESARCAQTSESSMALEDGRRLTLVVTPLANAAGASVEVRYEGTWIWRNAPLWLERTSAIRPAWVLAALIVIVIVGGLLFYRRLPHGDRTPGVAQDSMPESPAEQHSTPEPPQIARSQRPQQRDEPLTRSLPGDVIAGSLRTVSKVYVDPLGSGPVSDQVRDLLIRALRSSQFAVADNRDEADAVFKGTVTLVRGSSAQARQVVLDVRLINAAGDTLWPAEGTRYTGTASGVSTRLAKDLSAAK